LTWIITTIVHRWSRTIWQEILENYNRGVCSRGIAYNLTIAQKKDRVDWWKEILEKYKRGVSKHVYKIVSTVWVFEDEQNPTNLARGRRTSKQMVASFFGKTAHVATFPLEQRRKVNSAWYTTVCLPEVFGEIRRKNQRTRIILH